MKSFAKKWLLPLILTGQCVPASWGAMVIEGTRVVVRGGDKETIVKMTNQGQLPLVVQSWIDNGDHERDKSPDQIRVPYNLTPPISRVDPTKGQTVRIFLTGEAMPLDRESLYWFNILEIPPKSKQQEESIVQFTIRTRLKLIYRPKELGRDVSRDMVKKIQWSLASDKDGKTVLRANNTTPYYYTFGQGEVVSTNGANIKIVGGMAAPNASIDLYPEKGSLTGSKNFQMNYINDFGALVEFNVNLP